MSAPPPMMQALSSPRYGPLGSLLRRYIVRELIIPTTFALAGLTALVLMKDLPGFSDLVVNRGFGVTAVMRIAWYEIVPLLARVLPFAVLIGALVGLGRLRSDREILAVEAAGISWRRLVGPVLTLATTTAVMGGILSLVAVPWAARALETSLQQMLLENPGVSLRAGTVYEFGSVRVVAREVSARGDRLRGVLLWIPEQGQTIFAEQGEVASLRNSALQLTLHEGVMLLSPRREGEETRFETFTKILRENVPTLQRDSDPFATMTTTELLTAAASQAGDLKQRQRAWTEFHRRFAYPVASVVFGLLAVPLARAGSRFSRAAGGIAGLLVTVVYYGLMQLGEGLMQAHLVSIELGVWLPNAVVAMLALALLWREKVLGVWWYHRTRQKEEPKQQQRAGHVPSFRRYIVWRYVVWQYVEMLCLAFALLLVGYLLVDILERLHWFARYHADAVTILRFYEARLPLLVSRVAPIAVLLATALTVSLLSTHRELIGLRACGISATRALTPILFVAGLVTPGYFLLTELIVPQTNARADQIKERDIKERDTKGMLLRMMIWYRAGTHVYQVTQLDPQLGEAQELSIYDLGANGLPVSRIDARGARYVHDGMWELIDPVRVEISEHGLRETSVNPFVQLGDVPRTHVDTMHLGVRQLTHEIRTAEANGYSATVYQVDFHVKLAAPWACLLLPAVALFFAVSGPPFPGPALTFLMSGLLGVGHVLLTGVSAALGYGELLPPSFAGWGPTVGLVVLASALAARHHG
jgi:lipopolysaccharide export system permease protein